MVLVIGVSCGCLVICEGEGERISASQANSRKGHTLMTSKSPSPPLFCSLLSTQPDRSVTSRLYHRTQTLIYYYPFISASSLSTSTSHPIHPPPIHLSPHSTITAQHNTAHHNNTRSPPLSSHLSKTNVKDIFIQLITVTVTFTTTTKPQPQPLAVIANPQHRQSEVSKSPTARYLLARLPSRAAI